jgi:hypothetical protein
LPLGLEFQVNTYTTGGQSYPQVAGTPAGDFVVAWQGAYFQDGSSTSIAAQRLRTVAFTPPRLVAGNRLVLRDDPMNPRKRSLSARADDAAIDLAGGAGSIDDPTLTGGHLRVRRGRVKIVGRGAQLGHSLAMNPDPVTVLVQLGDRGQRYCAQYGGTTQFKPDVVYRGRQAPVPSDCPR